MGYKAQDRIEVLDYTFVPFADVSGITPEFSPEQIRDYWSGTGHLLRDNRDQIIEWQRKRDALVKEIGDAVEPDPRLKAMDSDFETWQRDNADRTLDERRKLLAALCSDQPSYDELRQLPGRVLDDFENEMQEAISPKASTSDSKS